MQVRTSDREPRTDSQRQRDQRARRLRADPTIAEHGSDSTYRNYACRCDPCTFAHSVAWYLANERLRSRKSIERARRRLICMLI